MLASIAAQVVLRAEDMAASNWKDRRIAAQLATVVQVVEGQVMYRFNVIEKSLEAGCKCSRHTTPA
jgi:hypothetical protein